MSSRVLIVLFLFILEGCATYQPMPLSEDGVNARLTAPKMEEVRIEAREIGHPRLKPIPFDDRDGLSPDEAAVLAVIAHPALRALRDQRGIASAQLMQAGILPNPQLSYSLALPSGGATGGTNTAFGLGLGWEITSLISRPAQMDAAQTRMQSVNLDIAWQEWQIAQAARLSAYTAETLDQQAALLREVALRLDENRQLISKAVKMGQATELQLSAVASTYAQAHQRQMEVEGQARKAHLQLKQALGLPPETEIHLQPVPMPEYFSVRPAVILEKELLTWRLDLLALQQGYASQEAQVRSAILQQFPKISLGLAQARDNSNLYTLGFGLSIDLPIFDRNQGIIALQRATRQQLFDEYLNRIFESRADVARLVTEIQTTNTLIQAAAEALPPLEHLVATYRRAVQEGQADVLNYYAAWNSWTDQRVNILSLKLQGIELRIALELASGQYQIAENEQELISP